mgnify:CR=1 FL=1
MTNTVSQPLSYFLVMTFNLINYSLTVFRTKNAQIDGGDAQIRTHLRAGYGHKCLSIEEGSILLKNFANLLLNKPGVFLLSGRIHDARMYGISNALPIGYSYW